MTQLLLTKAPALFPTGQTVATQGAITCVNCSRERFIKARLLAARFGSGYPLHDLQPKFRCTGCQCRNIRLGLALPDLAEEKLRPMTWFGGVYEKYED